MPAGQRLPVKLMDRAAMISERHVGAFVAGDTRGSCVAAIADGVDTF